jgi:alkylhydroperoxidase family enzyme
VRRCDGRRRTRQVTACIFGLRNAVPEKWRDVQEVKNWGEVRVNRRVTAELSPEARALIEEARECLRDPAPGPVAPTKGHGVHANGATRH